MLTLKRTILMLAAMLASGMLFAAPASAQATRTWVSGVGDDANPCSRTAPCKTFQGAISKTAAGGEINCLDPGGFGAVTITKSIQIICDNVQQAGVLVASTNAIIINVPTGTYVTLSGLYLDGLGSTGSPGINGVNILQSGNIALRNMTITGFRNGYGVNFIPTATGKLVMSNVTLTESGIASTPTTGGVLVSPAAGVTATVTINNSRIQNNENVGVRLDTVGIVGSVINATIDGSVISGNANGLLIKSPASTGTVKAMIARTVVDENSSYGIIVNGSGSTVRVGNSVISNNATGVAALASAVISSYGNNLLDGNGADGAFTGAVIPTR